MANRPQKPRPLRENTAAEKRLRTLLFEPMLLLRTDSLPDSAQWLYELKLDRYRAIALKRDGVVHLRSRNHNDFTARYPGVVTGLAKMSDNTVIGGEVHCVPLMVSHR